MRRRRSTSWEKPVHSRRRNTKNGLDVSFSRWCRTDKMRMTSFGRRAWSTDASSRSSSWVQQFVRGVFGNSLRLAGQEDGALSESSGSVVMPPARSAFGVGFLVMPAVGHNYAMISWGRLNGRLQAGPWMESTFRSRNDRCRVCRQTIHLLDGWRHHVASICMGGEDADVATHLRLYIDGVDNESHRQRTLAEEGNL